MFGHMIESKKYLFIPVLKRILGNIKELKNNIIC
jgi:hypothetical protein